MGTAVAQWLGAALLEGTAVAQWLGAALLVGTAVAQWLRCCATNWNVAVSIPANVSEFFIDIKSFRSQK